MRLLPILFCILLCTSAAYAQTNSIKLLAVIEDSKQGTIVDLHLDIIPGSGRVFLETYPLSQIDTQISLRIAKTIACQTSEVYCLNKDFIYSVNAQSPVVAGPSAGAAIAVLTMATLKNTNIDPNIVITGTINSGGVIGPVGGVKEKIKAAVDVGVTKVLIPRGEENATQIIEYGKEIGVIVQEVATIDEAYEAITGIRQEYAPLVVDESYQETMRAVAEDLCARNKELIDSVPVTSGKTYNFSISLSEQAKKLFDEEKYYSAASRCFGSNVQARQLLLNDSKTFASDVESIETQLAVLEQGLNQTRLTKLGDLETAMIIRERIEDARKNLEEFKESKSIQDLAYAIERTQSAYTWKKFFGFSDTAIDETKLKESCTLKIEEVKELYNYIAIYSPILVKETKRELEKAESYLETEDYALCLFKASKSKAEIDTALSALYVSEDTADILLQNKLLAAEKTIQKQIEDDAFPILGYSYYEYAQVLNESEKYTALLYAEYGIEMSNLKIYFPQKKPFGIEINERAALTLVLGFLIGVILFAFRKPFRRNKLELRRRK